jgi:hypothetical protein
MEASLAALAANSPTSEVSESCMGLFKDFDSFAENSRSFFFSSRQTGKDYNDFGKFANCVENPRTHYSLI